MHELRKRGIEASEEGGNPLADEPVVAALLALLTLADHPADSVALFHVGTSPLGPIVGLAWDAARETVGRVTRGLRRTLLEDGYGSALARLSERLLPVVTAHEEARLSALVDIAYAYEPFATLRPRDFVAHVKQKKVEDPRASVVRVGGKLYLEEPQFIPRTEVLFLAPNKAVALESGMEFSFGTDAKGSVDRIEIPGVPPLKRSR